MADVSLEKLSKSFKPTAQAGEVPAVQSLDLHVADGELLVLVGPSGCGKSTTLRLIAGLDEPTQGGVRIGGRWMNGVDPADRDVAMVLQHHALYPHLSVFDNIALGLQIRKVAAMDIRSRVKAAAGFLELEGVLERLPRELSGGQHQRVALGRAMVREPAVFLLDEPLSNLDAPMRLQLRVELARLHRRLGTTLIHVTHDQSEAMALGGRIAVIKDGRLQQVADPITLYQAPANQFVASFMGSPPMNFFVGRIRAESGATWFVEDRGSDTPAALRFRAAEGLEAGSRVIAGLRPEWLRPVTGSSQGMLRGQVDWVERLGPETIIHCSRGDSRWAVRVPGLPGCGVNDEAGFVADPELVVYFDITTGNRIPASASPSSSVVPAGKCCG